MNEGQSAAQALSGKLSVYRGGETPRAGRRTGAGAGRGDADYHGG